MSTFDPSTNHLNDNAVAAAAVDPGDAAVGRHSRPPAESETDAEAFEGNEVQPVEPAAESASERVEESTHSDANLSALAEVAHPFDQTNGIVEDVDRRHGETHNNDEQLDADPADEVPVEDDEPGRESPNERGPIVNTALITEEVFGDDERRKPRFD